MVIKVSDYSASVAQLLEVYFAFLIALIKKLSVKVTFNFVFEIGDTVSRCRRLMFSLIDFYGETRKIFIDCQTVFTNPRKKKLALNESLIKTTPVL